MSVSTVSKLDPAVQARLEARAKVVKALAHPTRLFIVEELARGECCVCELTDMVGADISTVSKHLALLRDSGLVTAEKRGNQVFHRLRCSCTLDFLSCVDELMRTVVRQDAELVGA